MIPNAGWIDSFLMAAAMAASGCPRAYWRQAITGFVVFDFLASRAALPFDVPGALAVLLAFGLALALIRAGKARPEFYLLVPVLGSVDNLFVAGNDVFQFWPALGEGFASGVAAWAGFSLGKAILARQQRLKGDLA
jgi:hypothetical protein